MHVAQFFERNEEECTGADRGIQDLQLTKLLARSLSQVRLDGLGVNDAGNPIRRELTVANQRRLDRRNHDFTNDSFGCVEPLPFKDNSFDCITIAFGLRNITDKNKALSSMRRILKPGGRLCVLEFSKPTCQPLEKAYDFYSFNILPRLGEWIAHDRASYQYLAESIRMHPDQQTLKTLMIEAAGFDEVDVYNLSGGIVALHRAFKY